MSSKSAKWFQRPGYRTRDLEKVSPSPVVLALSYAVCATLSSVAAAYWEGRLLEIEHVTANGTAVAILPFGQNISTLVDFVFLNPFVIFFLQQARRQRQKVEIVLGTKSNISPYHRVGLILLSAIFGVYTMTFYVEGSQSFDATLIPDGRGLPTITITGWIVYAWTSVYIAWLFFAAMQQGFHVAAISQLRAKAIPYAPFHPDGVAGIRFLMEPSLSVGYAMIGLLVTFLVFVIHDKLLYHIDSNRLLGFAVYVVVAMPLFGLPFYHLHRLMKQRRDEYLFKSLDQAMPPEIGANSSQNWSALKDYMAAIENADKYRKIVCTFSVWPVPISLALPPFSSIIAAIVPLAQKLILIAAPAFNLPAV